MEHQALGTLIPYKDLNNCPDDCKEDQLYLESLARGDSYRSNPILSQ